MSVSLCNSHMNALLGLRASSFLCGFFLEKCLESLALSRGRMGVPFGGVTRFECPSPPPLLPTEIQQTLEERERERERDKATKGWEGHNPIQLPFLGRPSREVAIPPAPVTHHYSFHSSPPYEYVPFPLFHFHALRVISDQHIPFTFSLTSLHRS